MQKVTASSDGMDHLFQLNWEVDKKGYTYYEDTETINFLNQDPANPDEVKRTWIKPVSGDNGFYNPLDYPTIAREFSMLRIDSEKDRVIPEDAICFAEKYGVLGNWKGLPETLEDWADVVRALNSVFIRIDIEDYHEARRRFNGGQPTMFMTLGLSEKLAAKNMQTFHVQPCHLFGVMWLQIADELTKGAKFQLCANPNCGNWFPIRSNKYSCSNKCKTALSRYRNNSRQKG